MSQRIFLQKATRIEGNADIQVEIDKGQVTSARFMVQDFRGFEKFIQEKSVESAPHIVARICGLCCTTHEVASLLAIEDALDVNVPASVDTLRKIAVLGEWISSHSLSYFFLTMPDDFNSSRGIFDLMREDPEITKDAFFLRKTGNRIVEIVAKRAVHPVALGIGRLNATLTHDDLSEIRQLAEDVRTTAGRLIEHLGQKASPSKRLPFPANHKVNFLAYDSRPGYEVFRVYNQAGEIKEEFGRYAFEEHVTELRVDWSLAKFPYLAGLGFPDGILLVGPLSRLFQPGGVLDDPELANFELTARLRHSTSYSLDDLDVCRLLEIFWAAKQILTHVDEVDLEQTNGSKANLEKTGKGMGVVEAPRGVLVHSYLVREGLMERMRLLVATQFNNAYINLVLQDQAERYVEENDLSEEGKEIIARCIRTFDPCLTCATH